MTNWKIKTISSLCEKIYTRGTPNTKKREYWNGDLKWLSSGETRNKFIFNTEKRITELGAKKSSTRLAHSGDVVMASAGQGYTRGQVSLLKTDTYINQSVIVFKSNSNELLSEYLFYNLSNRYEELRALSDSNSIRGSITTKLFNSIEMIIPPLNIQKQIVETLRSLDEKIENNKKINHHLEQMAQAIFDDMFPNVSSGNNTIGEYIVPKRGKGLLSKEAIYGTVPVIAGGLQPATYHNQANTVAPVLTISASGANAGFVSLWHLPVWSSDSSYIDSSMTKEVYFWYVMLKKRQNEIYDAQTGSAQPHIYPKHIESLLTIEIDTETLAAFTNQVTPLFEMIGTNIQENSRLAKLRDSLLPKLMSGEISVSD